LQLKRRRNGGKRQVVAVEKYQKIDYNFHKILIPGSKGQKADASLLARGFLTS